MSPLSVIEIAHTRVARESLWLRGGFPDSYLAENDKNSLALRKDFIRTYLERDIPLFGSRLPPLHLNAYGRCLPTGKAVS
ncbi:hypothetical protein [Thiothrix subterranea]|uniref:hypothetical protein n=1 Tax=Thiothrix subterranea TaxID=2735563 RepID=UPI00280AB80B|nr:hypothetical protein [Thiothrix subterranea]